jgi:ParE toxin of type II toxin-antitoxin system, parDE
LARFTRSRSVPEVIKLNSLSSHLFGRKWSVGNAHPTLLLAEQPNLGRSRHELAENMRSFPIGRYVIFYIVMPSCIQVVRVLHGARDLAPIFEDDN